MQAVRPERFGFESALFLSKRHAKQFGRIDGALRPRAMSSWWGRKRTPINTSRVARPVLGSIQPQPLEHEPHGGIAVERIRRPRSNRTTIILPRTRLLALENTIGGRVLPMDYQREATEFAHSRGLATHLDGARIFNVIVN